MDEEIRFLPKGLKGQFIVAFINWLCDEMIGYITVQFTPAEAAEMLQLIASEGYMMRQEGECDSENEMALYLYQSIYMKVVDALQEANFGLSITMVEDDEPDDDQTGERISKEDRR